MKLLRLATLVAAVTAAAGTAHAATITHNVIDLPDTTVGQDLWQFDFTLGGPLQELHGITLLFTASQYDQLSLTSNSQASALGSSPEIQPDTGLGADGLLTFTALSTLPSSFAANVSVTLVWMGSDAPGAVGYELVDDSFNVQESGFSTQLPAIPEPSTWGLFAVGLAGMAMRRKR